jgi:hypothetical protein
LNLSFSISITPEVSVFFFFSLLSSVPSVLLLS